MVTKTATKKIEQATLVAQVRGGQQGTHAATRLRAAGFIPGIVYGKSLKTPTSLQLPRQAFIRLLRERKGELGLVSLRIESDADAAKAAGGAGKKPWEHAVLVQSMQHDPVSGDITHIDFHAIELTERIRVKVAVVLLGDAVGVKQDGGILEHFLREIEVECLPTAIPKHLEFNVAAMKIGDSIHAKDITPPEGVRITLDAEQVVASVLAPKVEKVEEVAAEAVTEPEVIREKKPKEGEEAEAEGKGKTEGKGEAKGKAEEKKEEKK